MFLSHNLREPSISSLENEFFTTNLPMLYIKSGIYLSGGISIDPDFKAKFRKNKILLEAYIKEKNLPYRVRMPPGLEDGVKVTWRENISLDIAFLCLYCRAIALMDDYVDSLGCQVELFIASQLDYDLFVINKKGEIKRENFHNLPVLLQFDKTAIMKYNILKYGGEYARN